MQIPPPALSCFRPVRRRCDGKGSSPAHPCIFENGDRLDVRASIHSELHDVTSRSGTRPASATTAVGWRRAGSRVAGNRSSRCRSTASPARAASTPPTPPTRSHQRRHERPLHAVYPGARPDAVLAYGLACLRGNRNRHLTGRLEVELDRCAAQGILALEFLLSTGRDVEPRQAPSSETRVPS
jgi:hypothetical protein